LRAFNNLLVRERESGFVPRCYCDLCAVQQGQQQQVQQVQQQHLAAHIAHTPHCSQQRNKR